MSDASDPRYDDFLIGSIGLDTSQPLQLLFAMVSTRNELQFARPLYAQLLQETLQLLSTGFHQQRVLLSGHMDCNGGHTVVSPHHLRLASAKNALPREAGQFLLLNVKQRIDSARDLLPGLGCVFEAVSSRLT